MSSGNMLKGWTKFKLINKKSMVFLLALITGNFAFGQNVGSIADDPDFFPVGVWLQSPSHPIVVMCITWDKTIRVNSIDIDLGKEHRIL